MCEMQSLASVLDVFLHMPFAVELLPATCAELWQLWVLITSQTQVVKLYAFVSRTQSIKYIRDLLKFKYCMRIEQLLIKNTHSPPQNIPTNQNPQCHKTKTQNNQKKPKIRTSRRFSYFIFQTAEHLT